MEASTPQHAESPRLYVPEPAVVVASSEPTAAERVLRLRRADGRPLDHGPGQFVQVGLFGVGEAPISIASAQAEGDPSFDLCVRRLGRVTGALHRLQPGDAVGIRGPYGRGFRTGTMEGRHVLFIAGGIGIAPLRSLVEHCLSAPERFERLTLLYGARTPADLLFTEDLDAWPRQGLDVRLTVDEGDGAWTGHVGLITTLLEPLEVDPARTTAAICGPPVMYRFVVDALLRKGIPPADIQVSLERRMRCGVGKCGHCAIGDLYACTDGPVFTWETIRNVRGALA